MTEPQVCKFINRETLAQTFPREFCETCKNNFIYRTPTGDCFWRYNFLFCFSFSEKITDILKQPLGALLRCVFAWERGVLDSTKLGHTDKIRCSVKILSFCVDIDVFWIVILRTNSKHPGKIWYSCRC